MISRKEGIPGERTVVLPPVLVEMEEKDETVKTIDDIQKLVKEASTSKDPVLYIQGIYPTGKKAYFAVPFEESKWIIRN